MILFKINKQVQFTSLMLLLGVSLAGTEVMAAGTSNAPSQSQQTANAVVASKNATSVTIKGNKLIPSDKIKAYLKPHLNGPVNTGDLFIIKQAVVDFYNRSGFSGVAVGVPTITSTGDIAVSVYEEDVKKNNVAAIKPAEAKKTAGVKKAAEAKKIAEAKKAAEAKKIAETKKAAEAKKIAETKKAAEAKKIAETKKAAEAKKIAVAKKAAEAKKIAEVKKAAEAKKIAEVKKAAEAKKVADAKKAAEMKKIAAAKKAVEIAVAKKAAKVAAAKKAAEIAAARKAAERAEAKIKREQVVQYLKSNKLEEGLSLSSFISPIRPIARLAGSNDSLQAIVPISKRSDVQSIMLHLVFSNSLSLAKSRSQLRFRFNDHLVGQVQLDPNLPEGVVDLKIPDDMIKVGYNVIKIESSLYTLGSTSTSGSELWAEIDAQSSTLSLNAKARKIDPTFSSLADLIRGAKWQSHYPLSILIASNQPSDAFLNAASNAVQGIALLTDDLPLQVHTNKAQWSRSNKGNGDMARLFTPYGDSDSILIGTYDSLKTILGDGIIDTKRSDKQVLIKRHPLDPSSFILVIAGRDESDVLSASKHFASMNLALANKNYVSFYNLSANSKESAGGVNTLQPMMRYNFSQLGVKNAVMRKAGDAVELKLKMPADLFATQDNSVDINLHFSYTPGMADGSIISVMLNGAFQRSIPVSEPNGQLVEKYQIKLPLRSFKKGMNIIRIEANIIPSAAAINSVLTRKSLKISLYDDSIVRIPKMNQYARLPDLAMLQATGYPYLGYKPSSIAVASHSNSHYSAALTLVAKLTQLQHRPVTEITLTSKDIVNSKNSILLLATLAEIKQDIWKASPFTPKGKGFLFPVADPYVYRGVPHNALTTMVGFEQVIDAFVHKARASENQQYLDITDYGVLSQFESQWNRGSSMTLLTAIDEESLLEAAYQLVSGDVWWSMAGDTLIWDLTTDSLNKQPSIMKISDEYHTGSLSFLGKVAYYAITSPVYLLLAVGFLVLMLAWLTRKLIVLHHGSRVN